MLEIVHRSRASVGIDYSSAGKAWGRKQAGGSVVEALPQLGVR